MPTPVSPPTGRKAPALSQGEEVLPRREVLHARLVLGWPHWRWRLWYLAALVCFPWRVSLARIKRSRCSLGSDVRRLGLHRPDLATLRLPRNRRPEEGTPRRFPRRAPPDRVIVLNCFGRGGSGIVWRMIGSSPDVIMTSREWHVGVFGRGRPLRKESATGVSVPWHPVGRALYEATRSGGRSKCGSRRMWSQRATRGAWLSSLWITTLASRI